MRRIRGGDSAAFGDTATASKSAAIGATDTLGMRGHVEVWKTDIHGKKTLVASGPNLVTRNGIDHIIQQVYINRGVGTRGANFLALSSSTGGIGVTDTILPNTITGSGLARVDVAAAGGVSHTDDTNSVTLSHVFTASAAVPTIQQAGLFISATATQPIHKFRFSSATSLAVNERLTVSWNITVT